MTITSRVLRGMMVDFGNWAINFTKFRCNPRVSGLVQRWVIANLFHRKHQEIFLAGIRLTSKPYIIIDSNEEPERYKETISVLMSDELAEKLIEYIDSSLAGKGCGFIAIRFDTGTSLEGNPVIGRRPQ